MKKAYNKPTIEVFTIITHTMLAASPNGTTNGLNPNAGPIDPGSIDAREFDFDEEYE